MRRVDETRIIDPIALDAPAFRDPVPGSRGKGALLHVRVTGRKDERTNTKGSWTSAWRLRYPSARTRPEGGTWRENSAASSTTGSS